MYEYYGRITKEYDEQINELKDEITYLNTEVLRLKSEQNIPVNTRQIAITNLEKLKSMDKPEAARTLGEALLDRNTEELASLVGWIGWWLDQER